MGFIYFSYMACTAPTTTYQNELEFGQYAALPQMKYVEPSMHVQPQLPGEVQESPLENQDIITKTMYIQSQNMTTKFPIYFMP